MVAAGRNRPASSQAPALTTPIPTPERPGADPDPVTDEAAAERPTLSALQRASKLTRTSAGTRRAGLLAWLERTRQRSLVLDLAMRLHERDEESAGTVAGSAVAFRLFLFFVPTLL